MKPALCWWDRHCLKMIRLTGSTINPLPIREWPEHTTKQRVLRCHSFQIVSKVTFVNWLVTMTTSSKRREKTGRPQMYGNYKEELIHWYVLPTEAPRSWWTSPLGACSGKQELQVLNKTCLHLLCSPTAPIVCIFILHCSETKTWVQTPVLSPTGRMSIAGMMS